MVHAVTITCLHCKYSFELQRRQAEDPRVVHAAGQAICDSDLEVVLRVSLALLICHDRCKGHHNCRQQIQSIWQRSAMGQLRWNLPSRHTGGGLRFL